mgnify:CR=1 FL=1
MKNRKALKDYFKADRYPTEEQFAHLIDSSLNMEEDGVIRTLRDGVALYPPQKGGSLLGIYPQRPDQADGGYPIEQPCWMLKIGKKKELILIDEEGNEVFTLSQGTDRPDAAKEQPPFDAENKSAAKPPKTTTEVLTIEADGNWHELPVEAALNKEEDGCRMYRIFGVYKRGGKKCYTMVEALAGHCNWRKLQLQSPQKLLGHWRGPIKLRWKMREGGLYLQMRGKRREKGLVQYQIITVWDYSDY